MKILEIRVFTRDKKGEKDMITIFPQTQSIEDMKVSIAKVLKPIRRSLESYYVVVAVKKSHGKIGYRTVVKLHVFGKERKTK